MPKASSIVHIHRWYELPEDRRNAERAWWAVYWDGLCAEEQREKARIALPPDTRAHPFDHDGETE